VLTGYLQPHATGHEQHQARAGSHQAGELRTGFPDLLQIVENQQERCASQRPLHLFRGCSLPGTWKAQRPRDRGQHQRGIRDGGQRHKGDAIWELGGGVLEHVHGQACLAHSAGASKGDEAGRPLQHAPAQFANQPLPANE
jgi:hypothetical protein